MVCIVDTGSIVDTCDGRTHLATAELLKKRVPEFKYVVRRDKPEGFLDCSDGEFMREFLQVIIEEVFNNLDAVFHVDVGVY